MLMYRVPIHSGHSVDSAIDWINNYLLENSIGFVSYCPMDGDLSSGLHHTAFEQLHGATFERRILLCSQDTVLYSPVTLQKQVYQYKYNRMWQVSFQH